MNCFVQYTGENYAEVLSFTSSYIHSDGNSICVFVFIPFEGKIRLRKGDYIIKRNNNISIKHAI